MNGYVPFGTYQNINFDFFGGGPVQYLKGTVRYGTAQYLALLQTLAEVGHNTVHVIRVLFDHALQRAGAGVGVGAGADAGPGLDRCWTISSNLRISMMTLIYFGQVNI